MYEFIEGTIEAVNPSYIILNNNGTGYFIHISLTTYSPISQLKNVRLFTHFIVREDAHLLYGFFTAREREIFRQLVSVSGVGANTARLILSSVTPDEAVNAILSANVGLLTNIKGIGSKTAQRIIVELKDKVGKSEFSQDILFSQDNTKKEEALSALVMLGFGKAQVEKVLNTIIIGNQTITVEEMVKTALRQL